jgi:hypothetical protein
MRGTRDELQQCAIRLLGEHHRLLKAAKAASMPERAELARRAQLTAVDAQIAVEKFHAWRSEE